MESLFSNFFNIEMSNYRFETYACDWKMISTLASNKYDEDYKFEIYINKRSKIQYGYNPVDGDAGLSLIGPDGKFDTTCSPIGELLVLPLSKSAENARRYMQFFEKYGFFFELPENEPLEISFDDICDIIQRFHDIQELFFQALKTQKARDKKSSNTEKVATKKVSSPTDRQLEKRANRQNELIRLINKLNSGNTKSLCHKDQKLYSTCEHPFLRYYNSTFNINKSKVFRGFRFNTTKYQLTHPEETNNDESCSNGDKSVIKDYNDIVYNASNKPGDEEVQLFEVYDTFTNETYVFEFDEIVKEVIRYKEDSEALHLIYTYLTAPNEPIENRYYLDFIYHLYFEGAYNHTTGGIIPPISTIISSILNSSDEYISDSERELIDYKYYFEKHPIDKTNTLNKKYIGLLAKIIEQTVKEEFDNAIKNIWPQINAENFTLNWRIKDIHTCIYLTLLYNSTGVQPARICANPNCRTPFLVRKNARKQKYCSKRCCNLMDQKEYQKRKKEEEKAAEAEKARLEEQSKHLQNTAADNNDTTNQS